MSDIKKQLPGYGPNLHDNLKSVLSSEISNTDLDKDTKVKLKQVKKLVNNAESEKKKIWRSRFKLVNLFRKARTSKYVDAKTQAYSVSSKIYTQYLTPSLEILESILNSKNINDVETQERIEKILESVKKEADELKKVYPNNE